MKSLKLVKSQALSCAQACIAVLSGVARDDCNAQKTGRNGRKAVPARLVTLALASSARDVNVLEGAMKRPKGTLLFFL